MEGIERVDDTESRMEDHKSCGGASGVEERDASMSLVATTGQSQDSRRVSESQGFSNKN